MVAHSRAPVGTRAVRALNVPLPIVVIPITGEPRLVHRGRWTESREVLQIVDRWRIDDEWWRERPIARLYYTLLLEGGLVLTVYNDLHTSTWYEQRG